MTFACCDILNNGESPRQINCSNGEKLHRRGVEIEVKKANQHCYMTLLRLRNSF